jgi:hypothetical protein
MPSPGIRAAHPSGDLLKREIPPMRKPATEEPCGRPACTARRLLRVVSAQVCHIIDRNTQVGEVGTWGSSSGPHLYLETVESGRADGLGGIRSASL